MEDPNRQYASKDQIEQLFRAWKKEGKTTLGEAVNERNSSEETTGETEQTEQTE